VIAVINILSESLALVAVGFILCSIFGLGNKTLIDIPYLDAYFDWQFGMHTLWKCAL